MHGCFFIYANLCDSGTMWIGLVVIFLCFIYAWFIEPAWLSINSERVEVAPEKLSEPVRFLFLSDLHASPLTSAWARGREWQTLLRRHQSKPFDAVLLGGDYIDRNPKYATQIEELLVRLSAWGIPMYAVIGNHDYQSYGGDVSELCQKFQALGVTVLLNQSVVLEAKGQEIMVVGLDDLMRSEHYQVGKKRASLRAYKERAKKLDWYEQFDQEYPELPRILLSHNPDAVYLPGKRPELVVSGHTHGGQYLFLKKPPKWFPILPPGSFQTWAGRRLVEGRNLIVGRGYGGALFPARLLCRPQALDITLRPASYPKNVVIGLSGKPRSGKDTVAEMIEAILPGITRSDFSHIMREEFDAKFGTRIRHDEAEKDRNRAKLTEFVNEKRAIDQDYWIKKVFSQTPPLLVTPIRFEREIEATKAAGGVVVLVKAPTHRLHERTVHDMAAQLKMHNEVLLDHFHNWDYIVENDGSLLDLETKVRNVVAEILKRTN